MTNDPVPMPNPIRIALRKRVLTAGTWSLAGYGLSQTIRFGTNLLMTRLLVPDMFGVMAIASVLMAGLAMFSDVGLKLNIVQSPRGNDPVFLNTAWVTQILRGVVLWLLALCIAIIIALASYVDLVPEGTVYADPNLPYIIAILSITAVIGGLQSTKVFEANRNLSLGILTRVELAAQIAGLLSMLGWVSIDRSVWALVAGNICAALVWTLMSHAWLPGVRNRWQWDKSAFRDIIHFGKWIFLSSILGFLAMNGDRLVLGGLVNASTLGVYVIAFLIFSSVDEVMSKIITDVSFPALSEIVRERPVELRASYYRFHVLMASFAYFCSGVFIASGQSVIGLLYDHRYEPAGWMLQVLAIALLTVPFRAAGLCFTALGMPRLLSHVIAVRTLTLFICTPIGFHYFGLGGALAGIVTSYYASLAVTAFYMVRLGLFDLRKELFLVPVVLIGLIVGMAFNSAVGYLCCK